MAFRLPRSNTSRARGHSCEAWPGHTPGSGICTAAEVWVAWCGVNYMYKNGKSSKRYSDESDEVYSRFLLAVAQDGLHRVTPGDQTHRLSELLSTVHAREDLSPASHLQWVCITETRGVRFVCTFLPYMYLPHERRPWRRRLWTRGRRPWRAREGEGFARRAHRKLSGKAAIKLANTGANAIPPQVQRSSTEYLANTEYVAVVSSVTVIRNCTEASPASPRQRAPSTDRRSSPRSSAPC